MKRYDSILKNPRIKEKQPKWSSGYLKMTLKKDTDDYVNSYIRDAISTDDVFLFLKCKDGIEITIDVDLNRIFGNLPTNGRAEADILLARLENDEQWQ
jgi:hypothetical protein